MPGPNKIRDKVLKHLRLSYPYQLDLDMGDGNVYPYADVKAALAVLQDNGSDYVRVLRLYMFTPLSRTMIADMLDFDPSTVKRKLDRSADMIMQYLNHFDFGDQLLFPATDPNTGNALLDEHGEQKYTSMPCAYPLADRNNF